MIQNNNFQFYIQIKKNKTKTKKQTKPDSKFGKSDRSLQGP